MNDPHFNFAVPSNAKLSHYLFYLCDTFALIEKETLNLCSGF